MKAINQQSLSSNKVYHPSSLYSLKDAEHANRKQVNGSQHGQVGTLFLVDALNLGGQFNSSNFIADFERSTEKLAEFLKELNETTR